MNKARRFERFVEIGCVACDQDGRYNFNTEVHHLNEHGLAGKKRRGDEYTVPLCAWHHRGVPPIGKNTTWAKEFMGPSFALHKLAFRERYGTDDELLQATNKQLEGIWTRTHNGSSRPS